MTCNKRKRLIEMRFFRTECSQPLENRASRWEENNEMFSCFALYQLSLWKIPTMCTDVT